MSSVRVTSGGRARLRNGVHAALVAAGVVAAPAPVALAAMGVGMIGQSNMVHLSAETGTSHYYTTNPLAKRWAAGALTNIGWCDLTGHVAPGTAYSVWGSSPYASGFTHNPPGGDGICNFVNQVAGTTNAALTTFEYAVIGSSIQTWIDDGTSNNWKAFHDAVVASGKPLTHVIWLQGEDNANQGTTSAQYQSYLRQLHNQLLSLSGVSASQFYFGIVVLGPGTTYAPEGAMGVIRQAQLAYVANATNVGAYIAGVATDSNLAGDAIHFDDPSQARMGLRYAKTVNAWAKGGAGAQGPKIPTNGANRSGVTVTVTVQHAGGTALKDGAGGTAAPALGFRFFDAGAAGAQIAYTASSITGPNTIQLTLASTPVGALTMDFGMANAPFGGTTAPASVIYDNDTVPGDTLGLPLQPCAAITVTGS